MELEAGFLPDFVGVEGSLGALPAAGDGAIGVGVCEPLGVREPVDEVVPLEERREVVPARLLAAGEDRLGVGGNE